MTHLITLGGSLTLVAPASADTLHVPGDYSTIQAAINAATDGDTVIVADGVWAGADFEGKAITVRSQNGPANCLAGRFRFKDGEPLNATLQGFTIRDSHVNGDGGAVRCWNGSSATIIGCLFEDNSAEVAGGAVYASGSPEIHIRDCVFTGNSSIGGGAVFVYESSLVVDGCTFHQNEASIGAGALYPCESTATVTNCVFTANDSGFVGGAMLGCPGLMVVNCAFSQNTSAVSGGAFEGDGTFINCSFSQNQPDGAAFTDEPGGAAVRNCIFWANDLESVGGDVIDVQHSCVEGGYPGEGNTSENPLFVNAGLHNLRLSDGSPCIDAGNNAFVPKGIEFDLDGAPRIQNGIVDMGAYEGAFAGENPAAGQFDFDQGDFAFFIPEGGGFAPLDAAGALIANMSAGNDHEAVLTLYDEDLHPDTGFLEIADILSLETTMPDGTYFMQMFIPFSIDDLDGADPLSVDLVFFDNELLRWRLAAHGNTVNSPGHDSPLGDRHVVVSENDEYGMNGHMGDYGVFWNPSLERGFVWANLDHAADFGVGVPDPCPADCAPIATGGDGVVDALDLQAVLDAWSPSGGPCDINGDGVVGPVDLAAVLGAWGVCP